MFKNWNYKLNLALSLALVLALAVVTIVWADDISNNLDASIDATKELIYLTIGGPNGSVELFVNPTGSGQNPDDGKSGCNLTGQTTLVVSVNSSDSSVATVSPSSITFTSCGDTPTITVTPGVAGSADITLGLVSNSTSGTFDLAPASFTVDVTAPPPSDTTPPVITPNVSGTLGSNGWYTSDVTVSWTVSDPDSTITSTSGCDPTTITADTTGTTLTCSAISAGGTSSQSVTIKRDATPPTISAALDKSPDASGWFNIATGAPTVSFTCSDATSGLAGTCPADYTFGEGENQSYSQTIYDNAGNSASAGVSDVDVDLTAPTASASASPAPNTNGWNNTNVTVSFSGNDGTGSGIDFCSAPVVLSAEGAGQSASGTCTDEAGNESEPAEVTGINIDKTAPTITFDSRTPANSNGWNNDDVTVNWTCSDGLSGPVALSVSKTVSTEGVGQTATGTCEDLAGNSASDTQTGINIDKTGPTLSPGVTPNPVVLNGSATADPGASDTLSGIDTASCGTVDTSAVGPHSVNCTAMDKAGNSASSSVSYSVIYATGGMCLGSPGHAILQPINADGNSVFKQKSTVPAKFRVCDANGVSIGTPGVVSSFALVKIVSGTAEQEVTEAVDSTTPDTAFRWSATDQQWIFNINTKNLSAGKTYFYRITLNDGSKIEFSFGLK